jgi:hypothetical protein
MKIDHLNYAQAVIDDAVQRIERMTEVALRMNGHTKDDIDNFVRYDLTVDWNDGFEFDMSVSWEDDNTYAEGPTIIWRSSTTNELFQSFSRYEFTKKEIVRPYLFYKDVAMAARARNKVQYKKKEILDKLARDYRYEQYLKLKEEFENEED